MLRIFLAIVLVGLVPMTAGAQSKNRMGGTDVALQRWDSDRDGTLDLAEVKKAARAKFNALNPYCDGTLDAKDLRRLLSAREMRIAPDKDGTIDRKQYLALVKERFRAANPDKDGTLDRRELNTKAGKALLRLIQ